MNRFFLISNDSNSSKMNATTNIPKSLCSLNVVFLFGFTDCCRFGMWVKEIGSNSWKKNRVWESISFFFFVSGVFLNFPWMNWELAKDEVGRACWEKIWKGLSDEIVSNWEQNTAREEKLLDNPRSRDQWDVGENLWRKHFFRSL